MVRKGKEKQSKGQPPPPGLLVFYIFFQLPLLFHTPRLLETLERVVRTHNSIYKNYSFEA